MALRAASASSPRKFAYNLFARTEVRNSRLRRRLIRVVAAAAARPDGCLTRVFRRRCERDAAYDMLSNEALTPEHLDRAVASATVEKAWEQGVRSVVVGLDASSMAVTDRAGKKGMGRIGTTKVKTRGLHVLTALATHSNRTPLGLCFQKYWARSIRKRRKKNSDRKQNRPMHEKETRHWLAAIHAIHALFTGPRPEDVEPCRAHIVMDRYGDKHTILRTALELRDEIDITVRASYNRRSGDPEFPLLRDKLRSLPARAHYELEISAGAKRTARRARMEMTASEVSLLLRDRATSKLEQVKLNALWVHETSPVPEGEQPIEWVLLTTCPIDTVEQQYEVVRAYAQRWLIEEFHRTWKSGVCKVERTQLRNALALEKWARILATVAVRAMELTRKARAEPDLPAIKVLSEDEIDAAILLRKPEGVRVGARPPLGVVMEWIAYLGGYTGKSSGGPPGDIVIGRGMYEVTIVAAALAAQRDFKAANKRKR